MLQTELNRSFCAPILLDLSMIEFGVTERKHAQENQTYGSIFYTT